MTDKRVKEIDKKIIGEYLVPALVSIVTTIVILTIFFSAK